MKKTLFLTAMALLPVAGFVACDDDDNNSNATIIPVENKEMQPVRIVNSGCLGSPSSVNGKDESENNPYCDYVYNAEDDILKLIVSNILAPCENVPEISAKNLADTIKVELAYSDTGVDCICVYSDTIVLRGFNKRKYTLNIREGIKMSTSELDLTSGKNVENRVYLDQYIQDKVYIGEK